MGTFLDRVNRNKDETQKNIAKTKEEIEKEKQFQQEKQKQLEEERQRKEEERLRKKEEKEARQKEEKKTSIQDLESRIKTLEEKKIELNADDIFRYLHTLYNFDFSITLKEIKEKTKEGRWQQPPFQPDHLRFIMRYLRDKRTYTLYEELKREIIEANKNR